MSIYQIKLTPVNAYFFGGEKHSKSNKNSNGFEMDYFVKSELYPQQTTLLGVLRYYLLMKNDLLNSSKQGKINDANILIGEKSFVYGFNEEGKTEQDFGKIKTISPLYFIKENSKFIIAPYDNETELEIYHGNYRLKEYDTKVGLNSTLINIADSSPIKFLKGQKNENDTEFVFIPYDTVGNKKGDKGKSEEDGFYKQTMYKLNKGWSFAFDAEIDLELSNDKQLLTFGAEKQIFLIEINNLDTEFSNLELANLQKKLSAIFCISDSFVSEDIWNKVTFAVNKNISFRNLQSSNSSQNFSSFSKGYKRGRRYNLLKRGSILYFETDEELNKAKVFFNNQNAQNIGFNKIQIILK